MKALIVTIVSVAALLVFVLTNPDSEAYSDYLRDKMTDEARAEDELAGALVSLLGGLAEGVLANATTRRNFVLFSVYSTELDSDELVVLGILGNFVVLNNVEE